MRVEALHVEHVVHGVCTQVRHHLEKVFFCVDAGSVDEEEALVWARVQVREDVLGLVLECIRLANVLADEVVDGRRLAHSSGSNQHQRQRRPRRLTARCTGRVAIRFCGTDAHASVVKRSHWPANIMHFMRTPLEPRRMDEGAAWSTIAFLAGQTSDRGNVLSVMFAKGVRNAFESMMAGIFCLMSEFIAISTIIPIVAVCTSVLSGELSTKVTQKRIPNTSAPAGHV
mmetsp:Transcript_18801/g.32380  ORF Transcript_18801/g.32380 Transcript_18801/m.32380 type:complete len:228 (+) Transcript_18801:523-1206(+)